MKKVVLILLILLGILVLPLYTSQKSVDDKSGVTRGYLDGFLTLFDFKIKDFVSVEEAGGTSAGLPSTEHVPPTTDNCGGTYILNNPFNNFGDPQCNFDKNQLYAQLQKLDPENADYWFLIVQCESSYNPNAYLRASASGKGAFGLYQMNPAGQGNGQYDGGNVVWGLQTSNAINYNTKEIGGSFAYWACA